MIPYLTVTDGCQPSRAYDTDAGLDLKAAENVTVEPGEVRKVPCGIKIEIPIGYVGLIFPRSGLGTKKRITLANTVGVIDSGYRGEIICMMQNTSGYPYTINQFERIAQLVVIPCLLGEPVQVEDIEDLAPSARGAGGFGHTGE